MSISSVIDTLCAYFNTLASFLSTIQRLKNEYHANDIDYTSVVFKLLSQPNVDPSQLGTDSNILQGPIHHESVLLSAIVSLAVYHPASTDDWTAQLTPLLREQSGNRTSKADVWRRGQLRPVAIDLYELHYMTTSKPHVYMAIYKPSETIVLSLPGTNSKTDWLSNLHSTTTDLGVPWANGQSVSVKVHAGFLYMAQCLATHPAISGFLHSASRAGFKKLLLCGHSQAGAVVSLLHILLRGSYDFDMSVVTFGSGACIKSVDKFDNCLSFVRCVRRTSQGDAWSIDPVPLLDETILSHDTQGDSGLLPMGNVHTLIDDEQDVSVRHLVPGQLSTLRRNVLVNFSADPHSMKGYLRALLRLNQVSEDERVGQEYLAMLEDTEATDDALAVLQLQT